MCKFYTILFEGVADVNIDIKQEIMSSTSLYLHHYSVLGQVRLFLEGFWRQKTSIGMTQQDVLK